MGKKADSYTVLINLQFSHLHFPLLTVSLSLPVLSTPSDSVTSTTASYSTFKPFNFQLLVTSEVQALPLLNVGVKFCAVKYLQTRSSRKN
jgi:hypothetical protein